MKRLLFVDDERRILEGLGRLLRGMRSEWEMHFAESGAAALELMRQQLFDVVITDMRMPGMDGAALLAEVRHLHPDVVRIVLSGHADTEAVTRAFGVAHQFLSKPCAPDVLKNVITRAFALKALLSSNRLKRLLSGVDFLPAMPSARADLAAALEESDPSPTFIGKVVSRDVGLTAQLLKIGYSACFGLAGAARDTRGTVAMLGAEAIGALTLQQQSSGGEQAPTIPGFSMEALWEHGMQTAAIAQAIARVENASMQESDEAFIAGVLHDIGRLALANLMAFEYAEVARIKNGRNLRWHEAEQHVLNATHAEAGAYLIGLWGFPDSLVEAVAFHETPARAPTPGFGLAGILHVANCLHLHPEITDPADPNLGLDLEYLQSLGLVDHWPVWQATAGTTLAESKAA